MVKLLHRQRYALHCGLELLLGLVRSQLIAIAGSQAPQSVPRRPDHIAPVAGSGLAKLAQVRIPGTVVSTDEPAPLGVEAVQKPDRLTERSGQMSDRRIDADHQIERLDERRRVVEIT